MRTLLYEIANYTEAEDFSEIAASLSKKEGAAMECYVVRNGVFERLALYEEEGGILVELDSADLRHLYEKTVENGGTLLDTPEKLSFLHEGISPEKQKERMISSLVIGKGGSSYLIVLDTSVRPLHSTVSVLRDQLTFASVALIGVSAALALLLARHISRPIERISRKAKAFSTGKYDLDFSERSYREIEELSETLNLASDELSKTERLQRELIANISHDLRTPLTMIIGYGEVMRDIEGENTPENIQLIIDEAGRLSMLVNDLLEISRIQGGIAARRDEHFSLGDLVTETVERYRRLKENSGFVFRLEVKGKTEVDADKSKISQVICNLFNNAINYSEQRREIEVTVTGEEGRVRVAVRDFGVGIAAEDLQNIWQRYYKVDKSHRRSVVGSGLGLSIVREILSLHDARYGVTSKVGEGSTFWFELAAERDLVLPYKEQM